MVRHELVNWFIKKHGFKSYLEVGVRAFRCFDRIECENKWWVDPFPKGINGRPGSKVPSDAFFKTNKKRFDVAFVDGLHEGAQSYRDVVNCFAAGAKVVVMHDCAAEVEIRARYPMAVGGAWNGTVWAGVMRLRADGRFKVRTIMEDFGLGIVTRGAQPKLVLTRNWKTFNANRKAILCPITPEELDATYSESSLG